MSFAFVHAGCLCVPFCPSPTFLHQFKRKSHPHETPLLPVLGNHLVYLLIYTFWLFYVNEVIQYVTFWVSSLFFCNMFCSSAWRQCVSIHSVQTGDCTNLWVHLSLFLLSSSGGHTACFCFNGYHKRYSYEYLWTPVFSSLWAPIHIRVDCI